MVVLPCPNRMLPVPKVTKEMAGEAPPLEVKEPEAVTAKTGEVVATIFPLESKAVKLGVAPLTNMLLAVKLLEVALLMLEELA